jgi:hypothetical protein
LQAAWQQFKRRSRACAPALYPLVKTFRHYLSVREMMRFGRFT